MYLFILFGDSTTEFIDLDFWGFLFVFLSTPLTATLILIKGWDSFGKANLAWNIYYSGISFKAQLIQEKPKIFQSFLFIYLFILKFTAIMKKHKYQTSESYTSNWSFIAWFVHWSAITRTFTSKKPTVLRIRKNSTEVDPTAENFHWLFRKEWLQSKHFTF